MVRLERKTPNFRPDLRRIRKELASRYYQLMTGHAIVAPYLKARHPTRTPVGGARRISDRLGNTFSRIVCIGKRI